MPFSHHSSRPRALYAAALACAVLAGCGAPDSGPVHEVVIPSPLPIEVTGTDFQWKVRYPGADGILGTADDALGEGDLHVPLDTPTEVRLRSKDYIYTFALPHLGLKEIAVPDLEYALAFKPERVGTYELRGDQMCGFTHPDLIGRVIVESHADYAATMHRLQRE